MSDEGGSKLANLTAQRIEQPNSPTPWLSEYLFALEQPGDLEAFLDARLEARQSGTSLLAALFAIGRMSPERYTRALAVVLNLPYGDFDATVDAAAAKRSNGASLAADRPVLGTWRQMPAMLVSATDAPPSQISARAAAAEAAGLPVVLLSERSLLAAIESARAQANVRTATSQLRRTLPQFSAGRAGPQWQLNVIAVMVGLLVGAFVAHPRGTLAILTVLLTVPFLGVTLVRLAAMTRLLTPRRLRTSSRIPDGELPAYTVMVALYDEVDVLPDLVRALSALDYPRSKLECMIVIEDDDTATKAALLQIEMPLFVRVVIVPEGDPRTKPRALNYALQLARGEYIAIYDAEDRPDPDQLRRAVTAFRTAENDHRKNRLACVQASLNIYNPTQSWLAREFTLEYSSLFDALLPELQRLRWPMPLGGTSNHFPRAVLTELQGWDPYNVTEDADLGIRIARLGYRVEMIASTTWEEAPVSFKLWLRQRTRWLKGWMQTYLVHTRHPWCLVRDLGIARSAGFHLYSGGLVLSTLVHPLFYAVLVADVAYGVHPDGLGAILGPALWIASVANLAVSYLVAVVIGIVATRRRGHRLALSAIVMPAYWLLISVAAYRALWQLYRDPYLWEKTPHGLAEET